MKKKKGTGIKLWGVLTPVLAILTVAAIFGTNYAKSASQAINIFLKVDTYKVEGGSEPMNYFETGFSSAEELESHDKEVAEQLTGEGAVLLVNNGALPLGSGAKVSALSHSSTDFVTCGIGSADIDTSNAPTFKEALESRGLEVNPTLWDFYKTVKDSEGKEYYRYPGKLADQTEGATRDQYTVNEVPVSKYTDDVKSSFTSYNDAAIVVISRIAGEGAELEYGAYTNGTNYLALCQDELDLLKMASDNFDKVIVIINATNAIEMDFLDSPDFNVDAVLWVGYTGTWGLNAVADILAGNVNPSGHLVDTFCYDNTTAPSMVGIYGSEYANYVAEGDPKWYQVYNGGLDGNHRYISYEEGIYVGYRYYETRYEDVVMGQGNASGYDYASTVAFPFGHGLSYTTFDWSDYSCSYDSGSDSFNVKVTVKNTGNVAGKEVVQVYFQSPYTDYDKQNGIEKAAVELCGFAKTKLLNAGESETVTISVPREELACYDRSGAKTYILDAGDYYLTAAHEAHEAVNNVLAAKGFSTSDGMTADGNADFTFKYTVNSLDSKTYAVSSHTDYPITNRFDATDLNYYGIDMTYLSRSDWQGTWPTGMPGLEATDAMFNDGLYIYQTYEGAGNLDEVLSAALGHEFTSGEYPTMGADNGLSLGMMVGLDYDDPAWEDLLDQATFDEMAILIGQGYHNTAAMPSVGKPATLDDNGPQGFTQALTGVSTCHCAYSDENIMAATYNVELMEEVGKCIGADVMDLGANGLYGPAMNIHRTAYAGRNFEYYSEDGFLSGKIAAAEVKGIQSMGTYVYIKHFALNDNETACRCISTWANEQAIRELYLKPFELAVTEGGAYNVMNSFARFGAQWSGAHHGLQTEVLRNEWGMRGFSLTDFSGNAAFAQYGIMMKSFDVAHGLLAGTDSWDSSATQWSDDLLNLYKDDPTIAQAMRQATHRILYTVANSNAMNGIPAGGRIVAVTPWWEMALYAVDGVLGVLTVVSAAMLVRAILNKKKSQTET